MEKNLYRIKFIRVILIVTIIATVLTMSVMMLYAEQKTIVLEEEETEFTEETVNKSGYIRFDIESLRNEGTGDIRIKIPQETGVGSVEVWDRYDDNTVTVFIPGGNQNFLINNSPAGNFEIVKELSGSFGEEGITLFFKLSDTYVSFVTYYNKEIGLSFRRPSDIEEHIVMIDPWHGGSSYGIMAGDLAEKNVNLKIAKAVKRLSFDRNYKVLLTRSSDENMNTEERLSAVNNSGAELYIGLQLDSDVEDTKKFGLSTSYNPVFYHGGMENVDLADKVLAHTATSVRNRANGLSEAGDEEVILKAMDIPATILYAGFISNEEEAALLKNDKYIELIAEGIVNALDEIYEEE